ncbi:hypothetical protein ACFDR9_004963 [Janthinobacterium sp. CG_23.3]|uniref:hypothetical protein n=1 Tax=Janthinobacterium sp. CG_23.3 TaxID=3349634 RepID=UPI0038D436EF
MDKKLSTYKDKKVSAMQFREQGKKIQCIRSTYDSAVKRSHQKVVGAFDRYTDKLPSVGLEVLTNEERLELGVWFDARHLVKIERINQYRVMSAALLLAQLGESIKAMGEAMTDSEVNATWSALNDVGKALRKAGHPKPMRDRLASVVSGQADLLVCAEEPAPAVLLPTST